MLTSLALVLLAACSTALADVTGSGGNHSYMCDMDMTERGKRILEGANRTSNDCRDSGCGYDCRGGQCVAYVKCRCKKNRKFPPRTRCWKPGTKVIGSDGKCNNNIPVGTAIATFEGNSYSEHAAAFMGCVSGGIKVFHQFCASPLHEKTYGSSHSFYRKFAVITSNCADVATAPCRRQDPGANSCESRNRGRCRNKRSYWQPDQE